MAPPTGEVLAMFSPNRAERRRCIDFVRALDEARALTM